jgi:hypothetical protein
MDHHRSTEILLVSSDSVQLGRIDVLIQLGRIRALSFASLAAIWYSLSESNLDNGIASSKILSLKFVDFETTSL